MLLVQDISDLKIVGVPFKKLSLTVQHQLQDNWCWAAVSSSVSKFYSASSNWTQCKIVSEELNVTSCCEDGNSDACDKPWYLNNALTRTGNLEKRIEGHIDVDEIEERLSAGKPIGIRIEWQDTSGHFILITGIQVDELGTAKLYLSDPIFGDSFCPWADLFGKYISGGTWTHTYETKGK